MLVTPHLRIPHLRTAALICLSSLFTISCGGLTTLSPTAPSAALSQSITTAAAPVAPAPSPAPSPDPAPVPASRTVNGVVGSVSSGAAPCWADRYPCQTYDFTLPQAGAIEVTLTWDGDPRAMKVQLYWAGEGLAHEDIAPRTGPSRISFRRPMMEAASYRLRVVSLDPDHTIPFSLTMNY